MDKLNLMASFIAVVEEGTYTAAAKRLGKTTALISTHVSQLEAVLAVRLITRSTRSLTLTAAGRSYYEEAKRVLDDITTLEAQIRQENHSLTGRLRLSVPTTFGEQVLMPFVAQMIHQHPQLDVEMMLNDRFVDIVAEGFDAAIRIGHLSDSALISRRAGSIRMQLCATPDFLTRHGTPDTPLALAQMPCVFDTNYRQSSRWRFVRNGEEYEVKPLTVARVNSAQAAANLALHGLVIAYAPDFTVREALQAGRLVSVLDEYCATEIPISILYPHRQHLSAKVTTFSDELQQYLSHLTTQ